MKLKGKFLHLRFDQVEDAKLVADLMTELTIMFKKEDQHFKHEEALIAFLTMTVKALAKQDAPKIILE